MRRKALNNRWSFSKQCEALPLAQSTKDAEEEQGGKSNNCIFSRRVGEPIGRFVRRGGLQ